MEEQVQGLGKIIQYCIGRKRGRWTHTFKDIKKKQNN